MPRSILRRRHHLLALLLVVLSSLENDQRRGTTAAAAAACAAAFVPNRRSVIAFSRPHLGSARASRHCPSPSSSSFRTSSSRCATRLYYKDERPDGAENWSPNNDDDKKKRGQHNNDNDDDVVARTRSVRRADVAGVSISSSGFLVLLTTSYSSPSTTNSGPNSDLKGGELRDGTPPSSSVTVPLRVTSPPEDVTSASSPEALTIIQLLSGIDMAGAVMHPAALQHVVALYCDDDDDENDDENDGIIVVEDELGLASEETTEGTIEARAVVRDLVSQGLAEADSSQTEFQFADAYARSRVQFPQMTLDGVRVELASDDEMVAAAQETTDEGGSTTSGSGSRSTVLHPVPLKFVLQVTVSGNLRLDVPLYSEILSSYDYDNLDESMRYEMDRSESILSDVCLSHDPDGSAAFLAMALALRYKSPVVLGTDVLDWLVGLEVSRQQQQQQQQQEEEEEGNLFCILGSTETRGDGTDGKAGNDDAISRALPQWRSVSALQATSQRVVDNIERSFEVHKLQGALRIATERGDEAAAEKIRAELDKFDSFDELPTTEKGPPELGARSEESAAGHDNTDSGLGPCAPPGLQDLSIPYDAAARLAYESTDKSMDYGAFRAQYEEDAIAEVVAKSNMAKGRISAPEKVSALAEEEAGEAAIHEERYSSMDLEERAFRILLDLGMVTPTPDPDSPDYDSSRDDELAPENVFADRHMSH